MNLDDLGSFDSAEADVTEVLSPGGPRHDVDRVPVLLWLLDDEIRSV